MKYLTNSGLSYFLNKIKAYLTSSTYLNSIGISNTEIDNIADDAGYSSGSLPASEDIFITGDIIPNTDNSVDLGASSKNIKMVYTKGITINGTQFLPSDYIPKAGSNQISGSLIPSTDNAIDIGSSNKKIKSVFANHLNSIDLSKLFAIMNVENITDLNNNTLRVEGKVVVCSYKRTTSNIPTPQASGTCFTVTNQDSSHYGIQVVLSNKGIYARLINDDQYTAWISIVS